MTTDDTRLWTDLGGQLACTAHLGGYATRALAERPRARRLETPLTVWQIFTAAEQRYFQDAVGEPARCETCQYPNRTGRVVLRNAGSVVERREQIRAAKLARYGRLYDRRPPVVEAASELAICYHAEHCGATVEAPCSAIRPRPRPHKRAALERAQ